MSGAASSGETLAWRPEAPRFRPGRLLLSWLIAALALFVAAAIVPGVEVDQFEKAALVAVLVAALNAVLPPLVAALRLPFMLVLGFLLVLVLDAVILLLASDIVGGSFVVDSFGWALLAALVTAAVSMALEVIFGANDDDTYALRVTQRIARRSGERVETDVPGIVFLEIDGLALPVLRRAMRDG
ncbi:MAG TPA: phage holin family protein, partial [Gaiellaceae bacterium]|nr:phage holin family protein [Gaiellaceae bacterium]